MATWSDLNKQAGSKSGTPSSMKAGSKWESLNSAASLYAQEYGRREEEKKKQEEIIRMQDEQRKYLEEFKKTQGGFAGTLNRWLGRGTDVPQIVGQTQEQTAEQLGLPAKAPTFKENIGKLGTGVKNLFTEAPTETIYDVFYQRGIDEKNIENIKRNNDAIIELAKRNKEESDENIKKRREESIKSLFENNKKLVEQGGGELAKKDNLQLVGQSLMTAIDLTPFLGFKEAGSIALKLGIKGLTKEALKQSAKKMVGETAFMGGITGLATGLQQKDRTAMDVAKSTGVGTIIGAGLGGILAGAGGIFAKLVAKRATNKSISLIEKEIGTLAKEEIETIKEGIQNGLSKSEIVDGLKVARKEVANVFGEEIPENITKETTKTVEKEAPSVISYIDNNNQKVYTKLTQSELDYLKNEVENIPLAKKGESQIHLDANTETLKSVAKEIPREEFLAGHPKIQEVFNNMQKKIESQPLQEGVEKVKVPQSQLPVGTGEERISRLEARVKDALDNAPEDVKANLSTYKEMNNADQIKKATKYVVENTDEDLMKIMRGEKEPPKGVLRNSIYVAMTEKARGDQTLAAKLASLTSTRYGQEIEILKEIGKNNPVRFMKNLVDRKVEIVGGREKVKAFVENQIKKAKKVVNKNYLKSTDWNTFIDSIKCK